MRQVALALVMARWAELDGPGALAYLTENEAGSSWEGDTDSVCFAAGLLEMSEYKIMENTLSLPHPHYTHTHLS